MVHLRLDVPMFAIGYCPSKNQKKKEGKEWFLFFIFPTLDLLQYLDAYISLG